MHCKNLKTMLATLLCLGALATPALAQFNISIDLGVPPPRQRYEVVQEMRTGYVLVPGFWFWDGHQHRCPGSTGWRPGPATTGSRPAGNSVATAITSSQGAGNRIVVRTGVRTDVTTDVTIMTRGAATTLAGGTEMEMTASSGLTSPRPD